MTVVTVSRNSLGDGVTFFSLKADGHAGGGKYGEDVICAGISTLFFTLLTRLAELEDLKVIKGLDTVIPENGSAGGMISFISVNFEIASAVFDTIITGFALLAKKYPKNVILKEIENCGLCR